MTNFKAMENNLLIISNNINHDPFHFRIRKGKNSAPTIEENSFLREKLLSIFCSAQSHNDEIQNLINRHISVLSSEPRKFLIDDQTGEITGLFIAAQKYNQVLTRTQACANTLGSRLSLNLVQNRAVSELNPAKASIKDLPVPADLQNDKPVIGKERRMLAKYDIRRYPGDTINHSKEASRIFISTQKERFLSMVGRIVETVSKIFGFTVTAFQKYHYRKNNETDAAIYAAPTNPINQKLSEPTSFWLGHASLFLSVPLRSQTGNMASFHVITDPVEGDLNALFYPRQTKCARSIEELPSPDIYLLSHNHLDHYSKDAVKKLLKQQPIMIVPSGDKSRYSALAQELGFDDANIIELNWWEKKEITFEKNGETFSMQISATPANHWCGQGPLGGHESTFLGYVIQGHEDGDIYFAGDTARLNNDHIEKLRKHFKIKWSFQPGGPDEVRKDMKSTHQASADGLWMHFKMMIPTIYTANMDKNEFLRQARELKTIYMHTMTYKLGNLHISDTKDSVDRVLEALKSGRIDSLKSYEIDVYNELCALANDLIFSNGDKFLPSEAAFLLEETVIVPKIGSRLDLKKAKAAQLENIYLAE